jgi:predicted dehydrogenase
MALKIRVAVLGTGALGKEHVRIYAQLGTQRQTDVVTIYDTNNEVPAKPIYRKTAPV